MSKKITTQVATQEQISDIERYLAGYKRTWKGLVEQAIEPLVFMRCLSSEITRNPDLLKCTRESLLNGFLISAELGLRIGSATGEMFLVPFYNKKIGSKEAVPIISYQGKIKLATQHKDVINIEGRVVVDGDEFEVCYGTDPKIIHKPRFEKLAKKETIMFAYAVAFLRGGATTFHVVTKEELMATMARSKGADTPDSPWKSDFDQMAKKTAVHRLYPFLPKTTSAEKAYQVEASIEGGATPIVHIDPIDVRDAPQEPDMVDGDKAASILKKVNTGAARPPETPDFTPDPTLDTGRVDNSEEIDLDDDPFADPEI